MPAWFVHLHEELSDSGANRSYFETLAQQLASSGLTEDIHAAWDVLQGCVARLVESPHAPARPVNFRSWFYTMVRNAALNARRPPWIRRRRPLDAADDLAAPGPLPLRCPEMTETDFEKRLRAWTASLPERLAAVVAMRLFGAMRLSQIADLLEIPISTAGDLWRRGLEKLQDIVRGDAESLDLPPWILHPGTPGAGAGPESEG